MKVKRFARVMALSLSLALAVPSVVPGAALTAEAAAKEVTLTKGSKKTLSVSTDKKVTWKSSKTSVATVSKKGVVKAVKAGKTTITATYGSKKKTWKVTVANVRLNKKKAALNGDDPTATNEVYLRVLGLSEDQRHAVTWNSSDTTLATVEENKFDASRATVKLAASDKKSGVAVITAQYKNIKMTCEVTVSNTGDRQDPVVFPAQATFNLQDNNNNSREEKASGTWNDVVLSTLDVDFARYLEADKAYLAAPMNEFFYTYHVLIKGNAKGFAKGIDNRTDKETVYWGGVAEVGAKYAITGTNEFWVKVNKDNEHFYNTSGGARPVAGSPVYEGLETNQYYANVKVPTESWLGINCQRADGSYVLYADIMTKEPITKFEIKEMRPLRYYGEDPKNVPANIPWIVYNSGDLDWNATANGTAN